MYDLKSFSKRGANFAPSNMIGARRKINKQQFKHHANGINYIFSDIHAFPLVRIVFKQGDSLITKYPTGRIPFSHINTLFSDENSVT